MLYLNKLPYSRWITFLQITKCKVPKDNLIFLFTLLLCFLPMTYRWLLSRWHAKIIFGIAHRHEVIMTKPRFGVEDAKINDPGTLRYSATAVLRARYNIHGMVELKSKLNLLYVHLLSAHTHVYTVFASALTCWHCLKIVKKFPNKLFNRNRHDQFDLRKQRFVIPEVQKEVQFLSLYLAPYGVWSWTLTWRLW